VTDSTTDAQPDLDRYIRAQEGFGERVHAVRDDVWNDPTPDTAWDVRELVNHLVVEQLWVPPLMAGSTIADVGDRLDGDQLGDDPRQTWDRAAAAARDAFSAPGALDRIVHLSGGDTPAADYLRDMTMDLVVHTWDLARALHVDERLPPDLVDWVYRRYEPQVDTMASWGVFAPRVSVPDDADQQTKLLAMFGRDAR
jgi:uncharacterized protein (TIGR03086 family)